MSGPSAPPPDPPVGPPSGPPSGGPPPYPPPPGPPPSLLLAHGPEAPRRRRAGLLVAAVVVGLLVVAAAVVLPLTLGRSAGDGTDLSATKTYADLTNTHTPGDVDYPQHPPVGGDHYFEWIDCGSYDREVNEEAAVHDLEHGVVWITYRPGLRARDVKALERALPSQGLLSPFAEQEASVVVTVWGRQLELEGPDDQRLAAFIARWGHGETAPEPMVGCRGGTADPYRTPGESPQGPAGSGGSEGTPTAL